MDVCAAFIRHHPDNAAARPLAFGAGGLAEELGLLDHAIARYSDDRPGPGPVNYLNLLMRRGRMEGFIVIDYLPRAAEAVGALAGWLREGKLKDRVDLQEGFEQVPAALIRLFTGENRGKQLVRIGDAPPGLGAQP